MRPKKIEIEYRGVFMDVSDGFVLREFVIQRRVDEAFASGKAKLKTDKIRYNIPPYSLMRITYDDGSIEQVFCSSKATHFLTKDFWIHNLELLETTAILEGMILGSKCFSVTGTNKKDYEKIQIIGQLMERKYGWKFGYEFSIFDLDSEINEFPFSSGTSVYHAFTEIAKRYNKRPKVTNISDNVITIAFVNLTQGEEYPISNDRILNVEYNQNVNDYCGILECEASNVVDRDRIVSVKGLTIRGHEVATNADNCTMFLPTRVEEITHMEGRGQLLARVDTATFHLNIKHAATMGVPNKGDIVYQRRMDDWIAQGNSFLWKLRTDYFWRFVEDYDFNSAVAKATNKGDYIELLFGMIKPTGDCWVPFKCLSEGEWLVLSPTDQPNYCYYKSGENEIFNVNNIIKDSLWEQILGQSEGPFVKNWDWEATRFDFTSSDPNADVLFAEGNYWYNESADNCTEMYFDIDYIPMTNPFIFNKKNGYPVNEQSYKPIARTYNNASEFIDHDLLSTNIQKANNMLGEVECSIEYDIKGLREPMPKEKIQIDGYSYYIISTERRFDYSDELILLNLARTYFKDAEAIGVPTQFNKVKNPYKGIIDRPIYMKYKHYGSPLFLHSTNAVVKFTFYNNNDVIINTLYKRSVFTQADEGLIRVYVEMQDEFAFDKQNVKRKSGYEIKDIAYVDNNNECKSVKVEVGQFTRDLRFLESFQLPFYDGKLSGGSFSADHSFDKITIYKDARERLFFTLEFENAIIVE